MCRARGAAPLSTERQRGTERRRREIVPQLLWFDPSYCGLTPR